MRRLLVLLALLLASPALATPLTPAEVADWRDDLRFLATELPRRHPLLFEKLTPTHLTQAGLDSAVADLGRRIPTLARYEVIVGMERIMAMVGAGHTSINPWFDTKLGFRTYPFELRAFRDGIYVSRADPAHRDLAGARLVRLGDLPADSALSHEAPSSIPHPGWVDMRPPSVRPPLWLSHPESRRWMEYLPESRTLYVAYQSSVPAHEGEPIDAFFRRVFAAADSLLPDRLVIDVRDNLGGNSFYNRQLVLGVVRRTGLDQKGKLFVILGGGTYSAAMNLVNEFERYTQVTFVGTPSGRPPSFFGDHRTVPLPHSGIGLNISSLWWQSADPTDKRPFVAPEIYAEPTAADDRAGRDPAMDAILARAGTPPLEKQIGDALAANDTARAARVLEAFRTDDANRYVNLEARVNALGYSMMGSGRLEQAVQVLMLNARAFSSSANAYDSLGEACERLGRREQAIDSYRRALALAPDLPSSREALRRLGATP